MRNLLIAVVIIAVLGIGAYIVLSNKPTTNSANTNSSTSSTATSCDEKANVDEVIVTYTDSGFSPADVSLEVCSKLTWLNSSSSQVQIGVNPHPLHTGDKTITNGDFTLDLNAGESKSVTVNKTGTFGYHNHLNSSQTGKITVN